MSWLLKFVLPLGVCVALPVVAEACNARQLEEDLRWCVDTSAPRSGRGDIVAGAYEKDARRLDSGFKACQSHSSSARNNYDRCTPGVRIDTARAILRM